eukprot:scaffold22643_cov18-Tisochrysis_lutea.AAC.1
MFGGLQIRYCRSISILLTGRCAVARAVNRRLTVQCMAYLILAGRAVFVFSISHILLGSLQEQAIGKH